MSRSAQALRPARLPWLLALGIAAAYIVVFVVKIPHNIGVLGWVSDFASPFVIPQTIVETGTGGHTVLSTTGAYVPLWFGLVTAHWPLHRQLWEIAPTGLFVFTALTVGWSVTRIADRRAALLATLTILVTSPWALAFYMAPAHNTTYPTTALLGAYLIWLTRARERGRASSLAVPLLATLVLGLSVASDALVIATGMVPFALTAAAAALHRDQRSRRLTVTALATAVGAVPIAFLTRVIMHAQGYRTVAAGVKAAELSTLHENAHILWDGLKRLFNGYLGGASPGMFGRLTPPASGPLHAALGIACDIVMVAALLTLLIVGARTVWRLVAPEARDRASHFPPASARSLHVTYWLSSAIVTCAGFEFSNRAGIGHESYYATVILSVAAVVPLLMGRSLMARWLVPLGAAILFAGSLLGLASNYLDTVYDTPISHYGAEVVRVAREHGVTAGYAGYWDASSLTWSSHERVRVRPVQECGASTCPFFLNRVPSWYVPKRRRTFLLVDPESVYMVALPVGLGQPTASYAIGTMRFYIYPYDIASRLGPAGD